MGEARPGTHYGVCPICDREIALRANGTLRVHGNQGYAAACLGAGQLPRTVTDG